MLNNPSSELANSVESRTWTYYYGSEFMTIDSRGFVSRPEIGMPASGQWKVTGAVRFNNFGRIVERVTLSEILAGKLAGKWQHNNGKQRWYVTDIDHGERRIVMSLSHSIS